MSEPNGLPEPVYLIREGEEWVENANDVPEAFIDRADAEFAVWGGEVIEPMVRESRLEDAMRVNLAMLEAMRGWRVAEGMERYPAVQSAMKAAADLAEARAECARLSAELGKMAAKHQGECTRQRVEAERLTAEIEAFRSAAGLTSETEES